MGYKVLICEDMPDKIRHWHPWHVPYEIVCSGPDDVSGVTGAATTVLTVLIRDTLAIVGLLAWLFYLNWKLTLIALVIGPPIALTVRIISKRLRRMSREVLRSLGDVVHVLQETIECHKVVKVFGGQDYELKRFRRTAQILRGFVMRGDVSAALTTEGAGHELVGHPLGQFLGVAPREKFTTIYSGMDVNPSAPARNASTATSFAALRMAGLARPSRNAALARPSAGSCFAPTGAMCTRIPCWGCGWRCRPAPMSASG